MCISSSPSFFSSVISTFQPWANDDHTLVLSNIPTTVSEEVHLFTSLFAVFITLCCMGPSDMLLFSKQLKLGKTQAVLFLKPFWLQDLEEDIQAFGEVLNCSIVTLPNEAGLHTAYVR